MIILHRCSVFKNVKYRKNRWNSFGCLRFNILYHSIWEITELISKNYEIKNFQFFFYSMTAFLKHIVWNLALEYSYLPILAYFVSLIGEITKLIRYEINIHKFISHYGSVFRTFYMKSFVKNSFFPTLNYLISVYLSNYYKVSVMELRFISL